METYNKYIGQIFDRRYRIEQVIGIGGMAVVFKATDLLSGRIVAIKMLREDMSTDETNVIRFVNESKAVVLLEHENIVPIYDVNVKGTLKYFVMEYLDGITLKEYLKNKGKLGTDEVLSCAEQILKALEHAHAKGIIHRDIKPQNIMLLSNGQIKVTDFGIAKLPSAETVTMEDKAIGTVYYISPEQASGKKVDTRTDIYSLGAMLYEMATGVLPFDGDNSVSIALMHVKEDPVPPREIDKNIPEGLETLIMIAMKRSPGERFQTANDMLDYVQKLKKKPSAVLRSVKKADKKTSSGGTSLFPIILGATAAFLCALAVAGIYFFNTLFVNPRHSADEFTVGKYVSLYYDETLANEIAEKFSVVNLEYKYSDNYDSGFVLEQSVAPNLVKKLKASPITLTISIGREQLVMPDLRFYTESEARSALSNLNFEIKTTTEKRSDKIVEPGCVITTEPAPNTPVDRGATVKLIVSDGFSTTMPQLVGHTEAEANKLLTDAGIGVRDVRRVQSTEPEGIVLEQSVKEGEILRGTDIVVDIVISGGLEGEATGENTILMLDVTNLRVSAAREKLDKYGLNFIYQIEYKASDTIEDGKIISTDPPAGVAIPAGKTIVFTVSSNRRMSDLTGLTLEEAVKELTALKLKKGAVTYDYSDTVPDGKIIRHTPDKNSNIAEGSSVDLVVSRGKKTDADTTAGTETAPAR